MSTIATLTIRATNVAEHMAQWEIHELRNILSWVVALTEQAEERGISLAEVAERIEDRVERFHENMLAELLRARAAHDGA